MSVPRHICTIHKTQPNTHTQEYTVTACYEQSQRETRKELNEGGDLRESTSRRPSVCLAFLALTESL
jgi:hypothetical protein